MDTFNMYCKGCNDTSEHIIEERYTCVSLEIIECTCCGDTVIKALQ